MVHLIMKLHQSDVENKEMALKQLSEDLIVKGIVKDTFTKAVIEREKIFSTGLQFPQYGVAIPHTDSEHVNQDGIALMTLEKPVRFIQMATTDQEVDVSIILMLAIKNGHEQPEKLQSIMQFLQDEDLINEVIKTNSSDRIEKILSQYHII